MQLAVYGAFIHYIAMKSYGNNAMGRVCWRHFIAMDNLVELPFG